MSLVAHTFKIWYGQKLNKILGKLNKAHWTFCIHLCTAIMERSFKVLHAMQNMAVVTISLVFAMSPAFLSFRGALILFQDFDVVMFLRLSVGIHLQVFSFHSICSTLFTFTPPIKTWYRQHFLVPPFSHLAFIHIRCSSFHKSFLEHFRFHNCFVMPRSSPFTLLKLSRHDTVECHTAALVCQHWSLAGKCIHVVSTGLSDYYFLRFQRSF